MISDWYQDFEMQPAELLGTQSLSKNYFQNFFQKKKIFQKAARSQPRGGTQRNCSGCEDDVPCLRISSAQICGTWGPAHPALWLLKRKINHATHILVKSAVCFKPLWPQISHSTCMTVHSSASTLSPVQSCWKVSVLHSEPLISYS